ncbi:hypothetical protein BGZ73_007767 [Actinomortierella ambigua]|nr:hypothetical protein BGZ73_007767 [Actinomortierella ambigua]
MSDLPAIYKGLLESNDGDIVVKLNDGKELKIISYLIKRRSLVFKTMMESPTQEAVTGIVDLSSAYGLEAFREFMAYVYYNKLYTGSYIPLLFEILSITDYYGVDTYKTYISDRIVKLITNVPICLMVASEALKYGSLTDMVYHACLEFLAAAVDPPSSEHYDKNSGNMGGCSCSDYSTKHKVDRKGERTQKCPVHSPKKIIITPLSISELPEFIVGDLRSVMSAAKEFSGERSLEPIPTSEDSF